MHSIFVSVHSKFKIQNKNQTYLLLNKLDNET
jgi:hypothetical protein